MKDLSSLSEKEKAEIDSLLLGYDIFKKVYRNDPVNFCKHCIDFPQGQGLAKYQEKAMNELMVNKKLSVRSLHGSGKSALCALLAIFFILTRSDDPGTDWKIITTASVSRQLYKYLWPEIHKWAGRIKWDKVGREPFSARELLTNEIKTSNGIAFAATSNDAGNLEGAHASGTIVYIFDESKLIDGSVFDAAEGAFSNMSDGHEAFALSVSTPGPKMGRFYDIQARKEGFEDWTVMHIGLDDAVEAGRVNREWAEQRKKQWGENSPLYQSKVLGNFSDLDSSGLISLTAVEQSQELWRRIVDAGYTFPDEDLRAIGVDVGKGGDLSTIASVYETSYEGRTIRIVKEVLKKNFDKTMQLVSFISGMFRKDIQVRIDAIGIGAGASERLSELGYNNVEPFIASERTDRMDKTNTWHLANKRTAAWVNVKEMLDDDSDIALALPDDDMVIGDLTSPRILEKAGGVLGLEGKDEIRKRLRRSTDVADAIVHSVWEWSDGNYGIFF